MNMEERIRRINELYHKSQAVGLTDGEKAEQARLRREYVDNIRGNLRAQLNNIVIERPDGTVEKLGEKFGGKGKVKKTSSVSGTGGDFERKPGDREMAQTTRGLGAAGKAHGVHENKPKKESGEH